jgi:hypothetical protein
MTMILRLVAFLGKVIHNLVTSIVHDISILKAK